MNRFFQLLLISSLLSLLPVATANACGGFFCQAVPINQAGEQIVFRQEGDTTTAMVRILYQGEAENFSWVVPVPNTPELSVGADATFDQLEIATRPIFSLERQGDTCNIDDGGGTTGGGVTVFSEADSADGGVIIEQTLSVGPFDVQIISSDNPDDLATWLMDNGYDLSDRGRDLIAPYVNDGMKFVALKLRRGEVTGSIQPLIMRYQSNAPMIPIRLTAVAAQDDMGVLVWIVGDSRAVPNNYLHVTPNYTRLNWYAGTFNAYASYQTLITEAMNAAGGQGFATDVATPINASITNFLTTAEMLEEQLAQLDRFKGDADFLANIAFIGNTPATTTALQLALPLPDGRFADLYADPIQLQTTYTSEALAAARTAVREAFIAAEIEPLRDSVALIPEGSYLTRLYTTLSADEMTLDPTFVFNTSMPDQSLERRALLESSCGDNGTQWTLTLGAGTGREGEQVINAEIPIPFAVPDPVALQVPTYRIEVTSADAEPQVTELANLTVLELRADGSVTGSMNGSDDDNGFLGALGIGWLSLFASLVWLRLCQCQVNTSVNVDAKLDVNKYVNKYVKTSQR